MQESPSIKARAKELDRLDAREQLAREIFIAWAATDSPCPESANSAFRVADYFLEEAERRREDVK